MRRTRARGSADGGRAPPASLRGWAGLCPRAAQRLVASGAIFLENRSSLAASSHEWARGPLVAARRHLAPRLLAGAQVAHDGRSRGRPESSDGRLIWASDEAFAGRERAKVPRPKHESNSSAGLMKSFAGPPKTRPALRCLLRFGCPIPAAHVRHQTAGVGRRSLGWSAFCCFNSAPRPSTFGLPLHACTHARTRAVSLATQTHARTHAQRRRHTRASPSPAKLCAKKVGCAQLCPAAGQEASNCNQRERNTSAPLASAQNQREQRPTVLAFPACPARAPQQPLLPPPPPAA